VWPGEDGAPPAPGELYVPFGLSGFEESSIVFSAWRLEGLSTIGNSPLTGIFFEKESSLMC
jgi:hypothetical protein